MTDHPNPVPLSRSSRRLLQLALATPRPCPRCGGCICLTPPERRTLRRVTRIARQWRRQVDRRARQIAKARLEARNMGPG